MVLPVRFQGILQSNGSPLLGPLVSANSTNSASANINSISSSPTTPTNGTTAEEILEKIDTIVTRHPIFSAKRSGLFSRRTDWYLSAVFFQAMQLVSLIKWCTLGVERLIGKAKRLHSNCELPSTLNVRFTLKRLQEFQRAREREAKRERKSETQEKKYNRL